MKYLIASTSTWESEDGVFASLCHDMLDKYNENIIPSDNVGVVEVDWETACGTDNTDPANIKKLSSVSGPSVVRPPSQRNFRERRRSAVSGEWYRRVLLLDAELFDDTPIEKKSNGTSKTTRPIKNRSNGTSKKKKSMLVKRISEMPKVQCVALDSQQDSSETDMGLSKQNIETVDQVFNCDACSKSYRNEETFKKHLVMHMNMNPDKCTCTTCGKVFSTMGSLRQHLLVHSDDRPHKCDKCGNSFKAIQGLRRHETNVHGNQTPFKCSYCDKAFAVRQRCMNHEAIHDPTRRHICEICGYSSTVSWELSRHKKAKHTSAGYPYKCAICDKGYFAKKQYEDHLNQHTGETPYECKVCQKKFKTRQAQGDHKKVHIAHSERPFRCQFCDLGFFGKKELEAHIRVHHEPKTRRKVFKCKVCQIEFTDYKEMKIHRISHIGEKCI